MERDARRERDARVCVRYNEGIRLRDIASEFGLSVRRVRGIAGAGRKVQLEEERQEKLRVLREIALGLQIELRDNETIQSLAAKIRSEQNRISLRTRNENIRRLYASGRTVSDLAEEYLLTRAAVSRIVHGPNPNPKAREPRPDFTERNRKIVDTYNAGASARSIAIRIGVSRTRISQILDEARSRGEVVR